MSATDPISKMADLVMEQCVFSDPQLRKIIRAVLTEAATSAIPQYGPFGVLLERGGEAALGELAAVLHAGDAAAKQHLLDAGIDQSVLTDIEELIASFPQIASQAKALVTARPAPAAAV